MAAQEKHQRALADIKEEKLSLENKVKDMEAKVSKGPDRRGHNIMYLLNLAVDSM